MCRVQGNLMVIRHIEQVTGTSNQFTSIMNNFAIPFVKHYFLQQYMHADTLKREDQTFLRRNANISWMNEHSSEWFYFYASVSFSALLFLFLVHCSLLLWCWWPEVLVVRLPLPRGTSVSTGHSTCASPAVCSPSFYLQQPRANKSKTFLRYEEIYCYSFSERIQLGYYRQTSKITCNICGRSLF